MRDRRRELAEVAAAYWGRCASGASPAPEMTDDLADLIRRERHACRVENGGGGSCHLVTDWMAHEFGLERVAVSLVGQEGSVLLCGHYVCVASDGTIIDPTADQFGTGHDVRVLRPGDPDYGIYRPEFYEEFNPDDHEELAGWRAFPGAEWGWDDFRETVRIAEEKGANWWLDDDAERLAWLERDAEEYGGDRWRPSPG